MWKTTLLSLYQWTINIQALKCHQSKCVAVYWIIYIGHETEQRQITPLVPLIPITCDSCMQTQGSPRNRDMQWMLNLSLRWVRGNIRFINITAILFDNLKPDSKWHKLCYHEMLSIIGKITITVNDGITSKGDSNQMSIMETLSFWVFRLRGIWWGFMKQWVHCEMPTAHTIVIHNREIMLVCGYYCSLSWGQAFIQCKYRFMFKKIVSSLGLVLQNGKGSAVTNMNYYQYCTVWNKHSANS